MQYELISMGVETNVLFPKDNKVIIIQAIFDSCDELPVIFNKILSTFRF